jgi:uncharacterized membrane protein YcaP (DUF421 family)
LGKRSLAETAPFDFVLLQSFSEALQSALVDNDDSLTVSFVVILTLVVLNIGMSLLKQRFHILERPLEGAPIVVVEDGRLLKDRMRRVRIDEGDILAPARQSRARGSTPSTRSSRRCLSAWEASRSSRSGPAGKPGVLRERR